jgi:hypothetical protein
MTKPPTPTEDARYANLARHTFEFGRSAPKPVPVTLRRRRDVPPPHEQWLIDAPARSAEALEALGAMLPPPVDPPPIASGSSPFIWPRTETELRQALQYGADESVVVMLDPRTHLAMTETITVQQRANMGYSWGVNGNHAKLEWKGEVGQDMLVYQGVNGVANRLLFIEKLNLYGGGYEGRPAGFCLKLYAPEGDPGSLYKFTLRDVFANYATYGIGIVGAVFEGLLDNCHAENNQKDGLYMAHTGLDGMSPWSIVSNVMCVHPNMSRNLGAGIRCVNSTNLILGGFINNAEGGVVAPEGLRAAMLCNGENTGEAMFVVPYAGWGSVVTHNTASTDGKTHAAKYENGEWVSVGKPLLYCLDIDPAVQQTLNDIAYYGDGTNEDKIAVVKP